MAHQSDRQPPPWLAPAVASIVAIALALAGAVAIATGRINGYAAPVLIVVVLVAFGQRVDWGSMFGGARLPRIEDRTASGDDASSADSPVKT